MSTCMGKECPNEATIEVRGLDPTLAIARAPVRLCRACLRKGERQVSLDRWIASALTADARRVPGREMAPDA